MATFKITMRYERDLTFFVDAESEEDVREFLDGQDEQWRPGEVDGLVDVVSPETEVGFALEPETEILANFEIVAGRLMEKAQ